MSSFGGKAWQRKKKHGMLDNTQLPISATVKTMTFNLVAMSLTSTMMP
jgi:hypothetical protein